MKLRIVAGALGRRVITVDKRAQGFRPTQERIRQAVAETLKPRISGARAADVCAGSGAMGIELLSRGAAQVDFIENDCGRAAVILKQCEVFGIAPQCRVVTQDIRRFLDTYDKRGGNGPYDIIFYDPPYGDPALAALVPALAGLLAPEGVLVYERDKSGVPQCEKLSMAPYRVEVRTYGDTAVEFISRID
ncbi:MAG TPA: RsmD family RNA methyltransferase [Chitinivibrionales bacterium]|jgi:16S rRNA (guanine(966)-N(2))-methyltransferase RsmD|nr:RsmD family RNA methyltransferase [Chitinivibrionales bacterium]